MLIRKTKDNSVLILDIVNLSLSYRKAVEQIENTYKLLLENYNDELYHECYILYKRPVRELKRFEKKTVLFNTDEVRNNIIKLMSNDLNIIKESLELVNKLKDNNLDEKDKDNIIEYIDYFMKQRDYWYDVEKSNIKTFGDATGNNMDWW